MMVRTCLLISEDPDDHIEFSEALHEIADDVVLLTVSDAGKVMDLFAVKRCIPDFVILSSGLGGLDLGHFFSVLAGDPALQDVKVIAYGEWESLRFQRIGTTIEADLSFSELKDALRRAIEWKDQDDTM